MCVYFTMKLTEGIMKAVGDSYGSIKGCRCWLSQETAHIHSTVEDLGWGCGYRNIQMMISCLLTHPLYSDNVMSGKMSCVIVCSHIGLMHTIVFCGIPTILELQKAWEEGIFYYITELHAVLYFYWPMSVP